MVEPTPGIGGKDAERIAYFVIRIRRDASNPAAGLTGAIERLGSGRTLAFSDADELLRLITGWMNTAASPSVPPIRSGSE